MNRLKTLCIHLIMLFSFAFSESNDAKDASLLNDLSNQLPLDQINHDDEALEKIEEELAHFITFAFCDVTGNLKEIILPIDQAKYALKHGLSLSENSTIIKPDLASLRFLPWTDGIHRTAWFLGNIYDATKQSEKDPRSILTTLHKKIADMGYTFDVGIELDFFLLEKNDQGHLVPSDQVHYLDPEYNLSKQQEINLLMHALRDFKVDIEKIDHTGANGQWRLTLQSKDVLKMADSLVACKYALKVLTKQLRQHISFMPKPFSDKNGNKMHISYTLVDSKQNKNVFFDQQDPYKLSAIAKNFLAGNLSKALDLSVVFMPTVNSYKNLVHELQNHCSWSPTNYNTAFNSIVTHKDAHQEQLFVKFKIPDCTANIYLVLAGLLKSGIKGIKKAKELPDYFPETSLDKISPEEAKAFNLQPWPVNLNEALVAFEKSTFAKNFLGESYKDYLQHKRQEWHEYSSHVTDWELKKYL